MLTLGSQKKIVQKVVKTKTGQFVLATFLVIEQNGQFSVRLLSVNPVEHSQASNDNKLKTTNLSVCLPGISLKSPAVTFYRHNYHSIVSPLFDQLKFFISQPTRAPSMN